MSRSYEFRKLYADVVTERGDVLVLYLNYVKLAGSWTARASVEHYAPSGARTLAHGVDDAPLIDDDTPLDRLPLRVRLPHATFEMSVDPVLGAWTPPDPPVESLHWRVRAVRTRAAVRWGNQLYEGIGYIDWVRIDRPTRMLGLHHLRWGRVHLPDRTVVVEHLDTRDGRSWDVALDWPLGGRPDVFPGGLRLDDDGVGAMPLGDRILLLRPDRTLHDGSAFDPERVPRLLDRLACEALGGHTHETRWLGTAQLGVDRAPALYEQVQFGSSDASSRSRSA